MISVPHSLTVACYITNSVNEKVVGLKFYYGMHVVSGKMSVPLVCFGY